MKTIVVRGRFTSLEAIREFYQQAAIEAGLNKDAIFEMEMAIDEAVANIIDHALGGEDRGDIECRYEKLTNGLKVIFHDHGIPFDPEAVEIPDIVSNPLQRKEGGLGLYFMRQMMDEVCFSTDSNGGNLLTMVKNKE